MSGTLPHTVATATTYTCRPFMVEVAETLSKVENALSFVAKYPLIGTPAGVAKVALGILQTGAGFVGMGVGLGAQFFGNKVIFAYSKDHFVNGIGNCVAGAFEAIPLVGTLLWKTREELCRKDFFEKIPPTQPEEQPHGTEEVDELPAMPREQQEEPLRPDPREAEAARLTAQVFSSFRSVIGSHNIKIIDYAYSLRHARHLAND